MPTTPQEVRQILMASDAEFRRLAEEHSRYESQLEQLDNASYRSSEDLIQQVTLKKLKLRVKDQMEELVARHRQQSAER
jgi:uncharacterized protein YdcH (DUF465 family)